ncbi:MAG: lipoate--protein ligase family protein [Candidatus Anammoxibacter sp.]
MLLELKTIQNDSLDPCYHLAIEEYLLKHLKPDTCLLYLWQSEKAVVIGRNQNPWKECRPGLLERENAKMVRRSSGGGTVYHDEGNLNFSFIIDKDYYNQDRQLEVILRALRTFGINASINNRSDLVAQGKKFSGSAHRFKKNAALHHGTLLLTIDKDDLHRYLQPSLHSICGKSIPSIRSEVINLTEMSQSISVNDLKQAIFRSFREEYQNPVSQLDTTAAIDRNVIRNILKEYETWDWHYGKTPPFKIVCEIAIGSRPKQLTFFVNKGRIEDVTSEPFSLADDSVKKLSDTLSGSRFRQSDIRERLNKENGRTLAPELVASLMSWIKENHL